MNQATTIAAYLREKLPFAPDIALVLGSGLGGLAEQIENAVIIPYRSVPGFPVSTAPETAARRITAFDKGETVLLCVCPIVVQGDVEGGVLLTGRPQDAAPDTETARAVNIAAAFLAKWMEE